MDKKKKKAIESKGYRVGSVDELLGLSTDEMEYIELKLSLSQALTRHRKKSKLTQAQLAKKLKSFSRMVEPIMLIVMGCVVGLVVSSLILPIFKLSQAVG